MLDYHKGTISKCIFAFWVDLEKQKSKNASHDQIYVSVMLDIIVIFSTMIQFIIQYNVIMNITY